VIGVGTAVAVLFLRAAWNYISLCSAKPYDILKIKNAFVKSVQVVTSRRAAFEVLFQIIYLAVTN
jgi:hypothetical protein